MASAVRLVSPVTATVINSFRMFEKGEEVVINRIAGKSTLLCGVSGKMAFLPSDHIDETARQEIMRQQREII